MTGPRRLSTNLPKPEAELLEALHVETGDDYTTIVRRGLKALNVLKTASREGAHVYIDRGDGDMKELVIL